MPTHKKTTVQFPNLFVDFLKEVPTTNPNYAIVRAESESHVCSTCELSPSQAEALRLCNFSYFAAVMVPLAERRRFQAICDWGNWIFPFDDLFDNGSLRNDSEQAQAVVRRLLATFKASHERCLNEDLEDGAMRNMVDFHTTIWNAIRSDSSQGIQMRYSSTMEQYCVSTIDQVHSTTLQRNPSIDEVLDKRRHSVCVAPLFALAEFAHGIRLPSQVLENTIMHEIQTLGIDITLLHNDLLSYHKEKTEGVPHNLVAALRSMGMTDQEAVDSIAGEVKRRLLHFDEATTRAIVLGTVWHDDIVMYVEGVKNVIKANLYWSFHSDRFFSEEQKTRLLTTHLLDVSELHDDVGYGMATDQCSLAGHQHCSRALPDVLVAQAYELYAQHSTSNDKTRGLDNTCHQSEVENS